MRSGIKMNKDELAKFYSAIRPNGKMTKEEATRVLRRLNFQKERCFGYIPGFLSNEYKDKEETEYLRMSF